jgi:hypothetical protein
MLPVLRNEYFEIDLEPDSALMRIRRTSAPISTLQAAHPVIQAVLETVGRHPVRNLLFDIRDAPGRNDPEFEKVATAMLNDITRRFERVAMLVRTAIGKLHIQRMSKGMPAHIRAFDDEQEALQYLSAARPPR